MLQVYEQIYSHAKAGRAVTGSCFWMTAAASYPDYDGMTVYMQSVTPEVAAENATLQAQRDQQQPQHCSADEQQGFRVSMQGKLQKVAALADRFQRNSKSDTVLGVIRQHAEAMHDLNRHGKDCRTM